jgi:hypothetical protein
MAVDVERPDMPSKLWSQWTVLQLNAGDEIPLDVVGTFPDGRSYDVSESSFINYQSSDPKVATVNQYGMVTSVGPGEAWVWASYKRGQQRVALSIKVSVSRLPSAASPALQ